MIASITSGTPPPPPDPFNLAAYVLGCADSVPDKTALAIVSPQGATRWRYGTLLQAVQGIATGLRALGLRPGDRVLMRLGNEVEFPLCYLGAIWAGLVPVPASAALTVPEITQIACATEPRLIVAAPEISLPDPAPCPVLPALALREMEAEPPGAPDLGPPDRPAYIVFTSGTSGQPRGVVHAHRAIWARRMMWKGWYDLRETDRLLHAGSFNWTYTLGTGLMDPWSIGATALIPRACVTPAQLPLLLKRFDATLFAAAPAVYRQLLKLDTPLALPTLRHGLSAGEQLSPRLRAAWRAATGTEIHEALGMSECSTFISGAPGRPAPDGTTGYAQEGRQVAVLDAGGQPCPRGLPGTLAIHRSDPGLMLGYLDAPQATAAAWFATADRVVMHEDGALTYLGRADDMMNAGGTRVSPLEVEAALLEHPGIDEVACAEIEVKADTRIIAAFYTGPEPLPDAVLRDFAAGRLARYKQPRHYQRIAALPRAGNGKIDRKALRKAFGGGAPLGTARQGDTTRG